MENVIIRAFWKLSGEELKQKFRIYCVTKGLTITDFLTNAVKMAVADEH